MPPSSGVCPRDPPPAPPWPRITCAGCLPVQGTAVLGAVSATTLSVLRKLPVRGSKSHSLASCSKSDNKGWFWFDSVFCIFQGCRFSVIFRFFRYFWPDPLYFLLFHLSLSELSVSFCVHFLWDGTHTYIFSYFRKSPVASLIFIVAVVIVQRLFN